MEIEIGKTVYFTDPDNGISSGYYTIVDIKGDIIYLTNLESDVEAYENELSEHKP